ncbi:HNH endonuclease [Bacillus cereus]|nr:HNH endonuclease [Bacillus cereus]
MYKFLLLEEVETRIGSYHGFVLELLKCINNLPNLESIEHLTDEEKELRFKTDFQVVIDELKTLKKNETVAATNHSFIKVATKTDLKKYITKLKYEEYNILKKYMDLTNNYENILSNLYKDSTEYSTSLQHSFTYLYEKLLKTKVFNEVIGNKDKLAINEFKNLLLLDHNVCPYCDWHEIEKAGVSIDHFLPKSKFPLFSIYPKNLVMSCPTCNDRIKGDRIKLPIFHPYYDEVANYFKFRLVNEEIKISFVKGINPLDKKKAENFLSLFKVETRFNENGMAKKLDNFYRDIRNDVYNELKKNEVTLEDIKLRITSEFKRHVDRLIENKRKSALTKLKLDYLEQINNPKEIDIVSRMINFDIKNFQEGD